MPNRVALQCLHHILYFVYPYKFLNLTYCQTEQCRCVSMLCLSLWVFKSDLLPNGAVSLCLHHILYYVCSYELLNLVYCQTEWRCSVCIIFYTLFILNLIYCKRSSVAVLACSVYPYEFLNLTYCQTEQCRCVRMLCLSLWVYKSDLLPTRAVSLC